MKILIFISLSFSLLYSIENKLIEQDTTFVYYETGMDLEDGDRRSFYPFSDVDNEGNVYIGTDLKNQPEFNISYKNNYDFLYGEHNNTPGKIGISKYDSNGEIIWNTLLTFPINNELEPGSLEAWSFWGMKVLENGDVIFSFSGSKPLDNEYSNLMMLDGADGKIKSHIDYELSKHFRYTHFYQIDNSIYLSGAVISDQGLENFEYPNGDHLYFGKYDFELNLIKHKAISKPQEYPYNVGTQVNYLVDGESKQNYFVTKNHQFKYLGFDYNDDLNIVYTVDTNFTFVNYLVTNEMSPSISKDMILDREENMYFLVDKNIKRADYSDSTNHELFIYKYDPNNNLVWSKQVVLTRTHEVKKINWLLNQSFTIDKNDNIIVYSLILPVEYNSETSINLVDEDFYTDTPREYYPNISFYDNDGNYLNTIRWGYGSYQNIHFYNESVILTGFGNEIDEVKENSEGEVFSRVGLPEYKVTYLNDENPCANSEIILSYNVSPKHLMSSDINVEFENQSGQSVIVDDLKITNNIISLVLPYSLVGEYDVKVHGKNFPSVSDSFKLNILPVESGVELLEDSLCVNTIKEYSTNANIKKWSVSGGEIIGEDSENTVLINWNLPGNSELTLLTNNPNGCEYEYNYEIFVSNIPDIVIDNQDLICSNTDPFSLDVVSPNGGTYTENDQIINGIFHPINFKDSLIIDGFDYYITDTIHYTYKIASCEIDTSFVIQVKKAPNAPIINKSDSTLYVESNYEVDWYDVDTLLVSSGNEFKPKSNGIYFSKVTDQLGCSSNLSEPYNYQINSVRQSDQEYYSIENRTLNFKVPISLISKIEMFDLMGRREEIPIKQIIDFTTINNRYFFLRVKIGKHYYYEKIIN